MHRGEERVRKRGSQAQPLVFGCFYPFAVLGAPAGLTKCADLGAHLVRFPPSPNMSRVNEHAQVVDRKGHPQELTQSYKYSECTCTSRAVQS